MATDFMQVLCNDKGFSISKQISLNFLSRRKDGTHQIENFSESQQQIVILCLKRTFFVYSFFAEQSSDPGVFSKKMFATKLKRNYLLL